MSWNVWSKKWQNWKEKIGNSPEAVGDFNTLLSKADGTTGQKIKDTWDLKTPRCNKTGQIPTEHCPLWQQKRHSSRVHTEPYPGQTLFQALKYPSIHLKVEIIQSTLPNNNRVKLEINSRRKFGELTKTWKRKTYSSITNGWKKKLQAKLETILTWMRIKTQPTKMYE